MNIHTRAGSVPATPIRDVVGRKLARRLKAGLNPTHRALLALDLECGALWLHHLSRAQARALTKAAGGYVATLRRATPEQREAVKRGELALSTLHNNKAPTDQAIERWIAKVGKERVWAVFNRLTMPSAVAAE